MNRMQQGPALRMQRESKGHGRVLNPRETRSEIRAGSSATSLPACLPGFSFPAFTVCVSLPFLSFEEKKIKNMKKMVQHTFMHPSVLPITRLWPVLSLFTLHNHQHPAISTQRSPISFCPESSLYSCNYF